MADTIRTTVSIPKKLFEQADLLAQQLQISQSALFERAIADFARQYQGPISPDERSGESDLDTPALSSGQPAARKSQPLKGINQGDIYWVALESPDDLGPAIPHPYVIVQDDVLNHSRIETVVACALTSNIRRVSDTPGNVMLEVGEANLPKQSVVEVSKVTTIAKSQLGEFIGSLSGPRISRILAGMRFLQMSYFDE
jgi:mRNA interferase MazF